MKKILPLLLSSCLLLGVCFCVPVYTLAHRMMIKPKPVLQHTGKQTAYTTAFNAGK